MGWIFSLCVESSARGVSQSVVEELPLSKAGRIIDAWFMAIASIVLHVPGAPSVTLSSAGKECQGALPPNYAWHGGWALVMGGGKAPLAQMMPPRAAHPRALPAPR